MVDRNRVKKVVSTVSSLQGKDYLKDRQYHNDTVELTLMSMISSVVNKLHKKLELEEQINLGYKLHEIYDALERD
jgi:hypothetical protein